MSGDTQKIYQAVMNLPDAERAEVVFKLFESLPAPTIGLALDDERLEERLSEREHDGAETISWADVRSRLS